jgi:hypothetical protein
LDDSFLIPGSGPNKGEAVLAAATLSRHPLYSVYEGLRGIFLPDHIFYTVLPKRLLCNLVVLIKMRRVKDAAGGRKALVLPQIKSTTVVCMLVRQSQIHDNYVRSKSNS